MGANPLGSVILFLLRCLSWVYVAQPYPLRRSWGRGLGAILRLLRVRDEVIRQNLIIAYPGESEEAEGKRRELRRAAYEHVGHLVFEEMMVLGSLKHFVARNCRAVGLENWEEARKAGTGVIFLSSHVGNWEFMAGTSGLFKMNLMIVTKHLKPEWLHQGIEKGRRKCGVLGTYEPKTFRDVLKHMKQNGTVGIVLDQYAGPPVGVRVPFMGVPVGTNSVVAILAKRTGAQVLPVVNYRTPSGEVIVEVQPPVPWRTDESPAREIALNTAAYAQILEGHVRAHPDQWLWTHKRFKGDLGPLDEEEWLEKRARA